MSSSENQIVSRVIGLGAESSAPDIQQVLQLCTDFLSRTLQADTPYVILGNTHLAQALNQWAQGHPQGRLIGYYPNVSIFNEVTFSYTHFFLELNALNLPRETMYYVLCGKSDSYLRTTRHLLPKLNFQGQFILPYISEGRWSVARFDPSSPILIHAVTRSGTKRLWPVLGSLLASLGRQVKNCREPEANQRFMLALRRSESRPLRVPQNPLKRMLKHMLSRDMVFPSQKMIDQFHHMTALSINLYEARLFHMHVFSPIDLFLPLEGVRLVALIRDPRDVLVSFYFAYTNKAYYLDSQSFDSGYPDGFKEDLISDLIAHGGQYLSFSKMVSFPDLKTLTQHYLTCIKDPRVEAVRFEAIHQNQEAVFTRILDNLGLLDQPYYPLKDEVFQRALALGSFEKQTQGKRRRGEPMDPNQINYGSHRRGIVGDWKNHLTSRHKEEIKALIGQSLIDLGYEHDLNW